MIICKRPAHPYDHLQKAMTTTMMTTTTTTTTTTKTTITTTTGVAWGGGHQGDRGNGTVGGEEGKG